MKKKIFFLLLALLASACAEVQAQQPTVVAEPGPNLLRPFEPPETALIRVLLGESEEKVILPQEIPAWVPDGGIPVWYGHDGQISMLVPARRESYLLRGDTLETLSLMKPEWTFGPHGSKSEIGYNGYASIHSVVLRDRKLFGFYHAEYWEYPEDGWPFIAQVGIAASEDGGLTWQKIAIVITGVNPSPFAGAEERASGAGQPSAVLVGEYVYLYYTDWNGQIADAIHMARAPLTEVHEQGAWQKLNNGEFNSPGLGGQSTPIVSPLTGGLYAALAGVHFFEDLNTFVMTFETNNGFWVTFSKDGITWENKNTYPIAEFPQPQYPEEVGNTWYSYPTLVKNLSGQYWLYYSVGVRGGKAHYMVRRNLKFEQ